MALISSSGDLDLFRPNCIYLVLQSAMLASTFLGLSMRAGMGVLSDFYSSGGVKESTLLVPFLISLAWVNQCYWSVLVFSSMILKRAFNASIRTYFYLLTFSVCLMLSGSVPKMSSIL